MPTQTNPKNNPLSTPTEQPVLNQLGLSAKEAEIYQIMLRHGKTPASKILPETKLKRTTVYSILEDLAKKGIIEKDESGAVIEFRAKHPYALKEYLESQVSQIKTAESKLDAILPDFISFYNSAQNRPGVKFYEGTEGIKKVLADTLKDNPQKEIFTFSDVAGYSQYLKEWNQSYYSKERLKHNIFERVIIPNHSQALEYMKDYKGNEVTDIVFIDNNLFPFSTEINLYNGKVSFVTFSEKEHMGVIVQSEEIFRTLKSVFEFCWFFGKKYCGKDQPEWLSELYKKQE
jgi:sugar-specific transcriptional regulator TrmB